MKLKKNKTDPVIESLRLVPGLTNLADKALAPLVPLVDWCHFDAGDVITLERYIGAEAFIVVDGYGTVTVDDTPIATVGPGQFIGEMAMLTNTRRCATVRADTPMRLLVIGRAAFATFASNGVAAHAMALQLAQRLRAADAARSCDKAALAPT